MKFEKCESNPRKEQETYWDIGNEEQHKAKQKKQLENKDYKETNRNFIRSKNKCLDDSNMYKYLGS
jgi:hypothetical protein